MPRCTGIQILPGLLRAVELQGSARAPRIARAFEVLLPPPVEGEAGGSAIREAFRSGRAARDPSVLLLPASSMRVRTLQVPFSKDEQVRKVIKNLMEEHLHGVPLENVLLVSRKVRDLEEEKSLVLALALEKTALQAELSRFQEAGIDPQAIEADLSALFNAAAFAGAFPEDGTALVVDLEAERAGLLLADHGALRAVRSFRMALAPAPAPAASASPEAAPADPAPAAPVSGAPPSEGRPLEKLAREILRTLVGEGVDAAGLKAFAAGPLSASPALLEELSRHLGVALSALPAAPSLAEAPPWAGPCIGAALKGFGHDRLGFDFRQEEFAFRRKFERVKGGAIALAAFLLVLFVLVGANFSKRLSLEQGKHKEIAMEATADFRAALRHEDFPPNLTVPRAARALRDILKKKQEVLTGQGMNKDIAPIPSALDRWRDLAERINGASGVKYLTIQKIHIDPKIFTLRGTVDSPPAMDSFLNAVRSSPGYGEANLLDPKLVKDLYEFGITAEIKETKKK
jgi:hypothetical protein